jgi:Metallo-beta-lactamase superfamily
MVRRLRECSKCKENFISLRPSHLICDGCADADETGETDERKTSATNEANKLAFDLYDDADEEEEGDEPLLNLLLPQDEGSKANSKDSSAESAARIANANTDQTIIELLDDSGDESEGDVMSEREERAVEENGDDDEEDSALADTKNRAIPGVASHPVLSSFQIQQQALHALASTTVATVKQQATNEDVCYVCGTDLRSLKDRVSHIKRCSKKHGVTAKDVRIDDDTELFVGEGESRPPCATGSPINPYQRKSHQKWHGGGATNNDPRATATTGRTVNQILMAGARRVAKTKQIQLKTKNAQGEKRKYGTFQVYTNRKCPSYKMIPNTDFCCDGFQYAKPELTSNYFLTHFHADHYGGITKQWNAGTIYCSASTANLVHEQLGVGRHYLHPLPMHAHTVIESLGKAVTVTLLHANHCPGAVMFLFSVGKRKILHVGDFRWNYDIMSNQAHLQPFCRVPWSNTECVQSIDDLFLDTTCVDFSFVCCWDETQDTCLLI